MKIVYQTDSDGVFIGETVADESPLEPGVYLIPAGCIEVAPPAPVAGFKRVWNGAWVQVEILAPVETPPQPPVIPELVSKLALVKAMREMGPDGQPATGATIWDSVKAAIAAAGGDVEEDWQLANFIPRHDPTINMLAAQLVPTDPPRQQMLDALFTRAAELE